MALIFALNNYLPLSRSLLHTFYSIFGEFEPRRGIILKAEVNSSKKI